MGNLNSQLMSASSRGDLGGVEKCLREGADVNYRSYLTGSTPLGAAAAAGQTSIVAALLRHGANPLATSIDSTPLIRASKHGHLDCIKLLVRAGADLNAKKAIIGWAALHRASLAGHVECIVALLEAGAQINLKSTRYSTTALMLASVRGNIDCVRILLQYGADVTCVSRDGQTAADFAKQGDYIACYELLLQHQSNPNNTSQFLDASGSRNLNKDIRPPQGANAYYRPDDGPAPVNSVVADRFAKSSIPQPSAPPMFEASTTLPAKAKPSNTPHKPQSQTLPNVSNLSIAMNWKILFDDLTDLTQIGSGSFGNVYAARYHGTDVAVKEFKLPAQSTINSSSSNCETGTLPAAAMKSVERELELLTALRHPNVVAFMGVVESPLCVVMELLPRGSLHEVLSCIRNDIDAQLAAQLTWQRRLKMLLDAAAGMSHLHARNILHRDLKSPNILLTNDWSAKVADLGLSKLVEEVGGMSEASQSTIGAPSNFLWLAPEAVFGNACVAASDVYSFGVVMWELATGKFPWSHDDRFKLNPFLVS